MTLRDYFAAGAMQSLLASIDTYPDERWREGLAVDAYRMADAMLQAREAKVQGRPAEAEALYSEADEARMDIVGQNGNTAEHYEQVTEDTPMPDMIERYEELVRENKRIKAQLETFRLGHYQEFPEWADGGDGYKITPLYTAPQPAEQHPVAWIRIRGDRVIVSRCDWMYPASTEGAAGPRDEQRFMAVGRRDGDIVLPAPEGALDREDLKTMLTWPAQQPAPAVQGEPVAWMHDSPGRVDVIHASVKKLLGDSRDAAGDFHRPLDKSEHYTIPLYAAPQPAPDVSALVEALELAQGFLRNKGYSEEDPLLLGAISTALAAHRKGGEMWASAFLLTTLLKSQRN